MLGQRQPGPPAAAAWEMLSVDWVSAPNRVQEQAVLVVDPPPAVGTAQEHERSSMVLRGVPHPGHAAEKLFDLGAALLE